MSYSCANRPHFRGIAALALAVLASILPAPLTRAQGTHALPDLNGDGVADYFMRLPVWSTTTDVVGQFRVFSGADNTLIRSFLSLQVDDGFALSTSSAGDLDADGVDDLAIGAPLAVVDGLLRGKVYLVSGATGAILDAIVAPPIGYGGMTVAGLADLDADGLREIAYSARFPTGAYEDTGFVVVHSPGAGEAMLSLAGEPGDTGFGYAVAFLGDTNNDGSPEIAVSAPTQGGFGNARGSVYVFECLDAQGLPRLTQTTTDARLVIQNATLPLAVFGGAMYLGPDIDADGDRELVVGSTILAQPAEIAVIEAYDLASGALVESLAISAEKLRSDINGDLVVDNRDVAEALDRMDQPADPLAPKNGDVDGDGLVDAGDVVSVIDNIDQTTVTPGTFSNGQKAEVTELVTTVIMGRSSTPCNGVGIGPGGGGWGGIVIPPLGPDDGNLFPIDPIAPEDPACCLYKLLWLDFPPEDRPPPPPGCDPGDSDGPGGGGDDPPSHNPPGWSDDPGNGDEPPQCDGMTIVGPAFIEKGRSSTFTVYNAPAGFLLWDVSPYPGPLRPFTVPSLPNYSVEGQEVGPAKVIARVYEGSSPICGATRDVIVVDCESVTVEGPTAIAVGAEATFTAQNLSPGITLEWRIEGDLTLVSSTDTSATVRGKSAGAGHVEVRMLYDNEPLTCVLRQDVAVVCDFGVSGPTSLADQQIASYSASEQYSGQSVRWFASGPLQFVGPSDGWSVSVQGVGCGTGTLTARLYDGDGVSTGCVVNTTIAVAAPASEPLALGGLPLEGYVQLAPSEQERVITLTAAGVGEFAWEVESSVEDAIGVEPAGPTCTLRIYEPTTVNIRLTRVYCEEEQVVEASFPAFIFDLAIDSDNDNGFDEPSRTAAEDALEDDASGMKLTVVNRDDRDGDRIPDYADGYGAFGPASVGGLNGVRFIPIVVDLTGVPEDAQITFDYAAAPPYAVQQQVVTVSDINDAYYRYVRGGGNLRLWARNGFEARGSEDFIAANTPYPVSEFGEFRTLFVEAVNGSAVPVGITVRLTSQSLPEIEDTVRVLPFDSVTGLQIESIAGVGIHYGSAVGGPGPDLVLGSDGDDVIETGGGDDIIVGGTGDDRIDPGEGEDVIFAFYGNDIIGPLDDAATGVNEGEDTFLSETDTPITTEQVLRVYRLIYGEHDPWLQIFLDPAWVGGKVECVEGDGVLFSVSDWDRRKINGNYTYIIQLEFEIGSPFLAATHLRENLLHMASSWQGPTHLFQGAMIDEAWQRGLAGDDYDEVIDDYLELRQAAFENAASATALLSNIYVQSLTIFAEGADVVVSLSDLSEGHLQAAIGLFPLLPARIIDDTAGGVLRIVRANGDTLDEFVKRGRIFYGAESGLGFIMRKEMPIEAKMVNDRLALLIGTAQNTGGPNGQLHADVVRLLARERINLGDVEHATMNRSMRTATGLESLAGLENRRPDIVAVRRDGKIDLIEARSDSQSQADIINMLQELMLALPEGRRGSMYGVELNGDRFFEIIR